MIPTTRKRKISSSKKIMPRPLSTLMRSSSRRITSLRPQRARSLTKRLNWPRLRMFWPKRSAPMTLFRDTQPVYQGVIGALRFGQNILSLGQFNLFVSDLALCGLKLVIRLDELLISVLKGLGIIFLLLLIFLFRVVRIILRGRGGANN